MNRKELATRLRVERAKRGLAQGDAAEEIGLARATLYRLERGIGDATVVTLAKLARFYDLSIEELVEGAEYAGKGSGSESESEEEPAAKPPQRLRVIQEEPLVVSMGIGDFTSILFAVEEGRLTALGAKHLVQRELATR